MTPYIIRLKGLCIVEHLLTSPSNAVVLLVTKLTNRARVYDKHGYTFLLLTNRASGIYEAVPDSYIIIHRPNDLP